MKTLLTLLFLFLVAGLFAQVTDKGLSKAGDVTAVKFDNSGNNIIVGYDRGRVEMWNVKDNANKLIWVYDFVKAPVVAINFLDEQDQVVIVFKGLGIMFINKTSGHFSKAFSVDFNEYVKGDFEVLMQADSHPEKKIMAVSGNIANRVVLIDLSILYKSQPNHPDSIYLLSTSDMTRHYPEPDKSSLVIVTFKGKRDKAVIYDLASDIENYNNDREVITCIKMSPSLNFVLAGTKSGKIIKWRLDSSKVVIFPESITTAASSKDSKEFRDIIGIDCNDSMVISTSFHLSLCGQMQFWNASDISLLNFKKDADPSTCRKIKMTSNSMYCITTGDYSYRLWQRDSSDYKYIYAIDYGESVGYGSKNTSIDFFKNDCIAVGDGQNVFLYKLPQVIYISDLRKTEKKLVIRKINPKNNP